jgi:adenylate kinase
MLMTVTENRVSAKVGSMIDPQTRYVGAVVFLGAPGAGKGTQSKIVARKYGVPQISTGDLLRDNIARGTELGKIAKPVLDDGGYVSDKLVENMLEERIRTGGDTRRGFVLDGFPRTLAQAEWLDRFLEGWTAEVAPEQTATPVVINVAVGYNQLLRRLTGRRSCPSCGRIYNVFSQPPRVADICDIDGSKLTTRRDDCEDVISARLQAYERQTLPLIEYYGARGTLHDIDGDQELDAVTGTVLSLVENGHHV